MSNLQSLVTLGELFEVTAVAGQPVFANLGTPAGPLTMPQSAALRISVSHSVEANLTIEHTRGVAASRNLLLHALVADQCTALVWEAKIGDVIDFEVSVGGTLFLTVSIVKGGVL